MKRAKKILQYQQSEFSVLNKLAMWLGNVAVAFVTPFTVYNLFQGRWKVAMASIIIVVIFSFNTYSVLVWKKYYSNIVLYLLTPAIMLFFYMSITHQGIIGILWIFPTIVCFYYLLPERQAWIVNVIMLLLCTYLALVNFEAALASRIIATLSLISLFTAVGIRLINNQQMLLHRLAIMDSLTGLYNRNTLNMVLNEIIESKHKNIGNNHLMTLDIDHFKSINDQFGHDQGDEALTVISHRIKDIVADHGVVFRHGGEEFIAVIEQLSWEKVQLLAEKIRAEIEAIQLSPNFNTTISIGLAQLKPQMSRIDWIKESDTNLYAAKNQGRNRIVAS